jgi:hypothetical protein
MAQPGRNLNSADYKFGYNGKEKDTMNEEKPRTGCYYEPKRENCNENH